MAETAGRFNSPSVPASYVRYLQPVIFEPWARRLVDSAKLTSDQTVLDVAAGTGAVARTAAGRVGRAGRVIACDISAGMLAHVMHGAAPGSAPLETLKCSATELGLPDASIDAVLCQQGVPFISDRVAACREMRRVLRDGGTATVSVWLAGCAPQPFAAYAEALHALGVREPFRHAYDVSRLTMSPEDVRQMLQAGGFEEVSVTTEELELEWPNPEAMAHGIGGTPYGPAVATLDAAVQRTLLATLGAGLARSGGPAMRQVTRAVLGRGTRP